MPSYPYAESLTRKSSSETSRGVSFISYHPDTQCVFPEVEKDISEAGVRWMSAQLATDYNVPITGRPSFVDIAQHGSLISDIVVTHGLILKE